MSFLAPDSFETLNLNSKDLMDHFSQEFLPSKFHGIECSSFGSSRRNPFLKLKAIAMNPKIPIEDRMRAVRYIDRIPHKDRVSGTVEAASTIIDDERYPIGERYFFLSNHEKLSKLSDQVVRDLHIHFFNASECKIITPLILRVLSAQVIYSTESHSSQVWKDTQNFIINLALDVNESIRVRAQAADILCKHVKREDRVIGIKVIEELGELYVKNKMTSIYTNAQNVHDDTINESVMCIIRTLLTVKSMKVKDTDEIDTFEGGDKKEHNSGDIYERILKLTETTEEQKRARILSGFNFILIYPARYEGVTMSEILVLIWNKIREQPAETRKELEQRLLQELFDIDQTCGSGVVSRLVNVLSGYIHEEGLQIKMSVRDQLRSNVFARIQSNMRALPEKQQGEILEEISEDSSKKETAREFLKCYDVRPELEEEFVESLLISQEAFDEIFSKCLLDFLGVEA